MHGEWTVAPSGNGKDYFYRYIEFSDEAMREQENGSREVLTVIKDINTVTSEVQEGSSEMLGEVRGLRERWKS